jgi:hypothetical protein
MDVPLACSFTSAMNPAHRGAARLVPPTPPWQEPLAQKELSVFASAATSGTFLRELEAWFEELAIPD